MFTYGVGKEGVKQDSMVGVLLVQTLCFSWPGVCVLAEVGEVDVDQPTADQPVQHL